MAMVMPFSLAFAIQRSEPKLIASAKPTPHEFKNLSALDDHKAVQRHIQFIHFYQNIPGGEGWDLAKVIKHAIGETLVFYYPLAGRLREGPGDTLVVECTGEGVRFIEASANVRMEEIGDFLHPPFEGGQDLVYDVPGSNGIQHCPLLLIQVTVIVVLKRFSVHKYVIT